MNPLRTQKAPAALLAAGIMLTATAALAQHGNYAGQQQRMIKALSPQQVQQYNTGAGMGYARAAELNHYPGPMHVLELADRLGISPEQRAATEALMASHKAEAQAIGTRLVAAEAELDRLFAAGTITADALALQVRQVALLRGEFQLSHLETHRRMRALLDKQQIVQYDRLRGYGDTNAVTPAHQRHHGGHDE